MAATLALAACGAGKDAQIDPNLYPADFKAALLQFLPGYLGGDLSRVGNAALAPPMLKPIGEQTRYIACVRYELTGDQAGAGREYAAIFFAGALNQFVQAQPEQCAGAAYQPFPELLEGKQKKGGKSGIFPW